MLHKEGDEPESIFVNTNVPSKVDKTWHDTIRVTAKASAHDRVVQLVSNDSADSVSQQPPQGQDTQNVHIIV